MRGIVRDSGTLLNAYDYDPWGTVISSTGTAYNPHKYTGTYYDTTVLDFSHFYIPADPLLGVASAFPGAYRLSRCRACGPGAKSPPSLVGQLATGPQSAQTGLCGATFRLRTIRKARLYPFFLHAARSVIRCHARWYFSLRGPLRVVERS